ncbi:MAG: putative Fe-S cluster assembly protein SufT [Acidobacteriota bacterium]|nr:putative Fe-S cluster assembly protein SufT [Acidobacteriota bacterium]
MHEQVVIKRDVEAIQIPEGLAVLLNEGTPVRITQSLGGSYTVMTDFGQMLRVSASHADALGIQPEDGDRGEPASADGPLEERVWGLLKTCYDPEIPVNVVELGLIYDCSLGEPADGNYDVRIKMTLTAPGCGMGPVLVEDVQRKVESLPDVGRAQVELVFDPPWNPDMMSEAARLQLGFI